MRSFAVDSKNEKRMQKNFHKDLVKETAERDELGYAVSWKRAFSQLFNLTSWLHGFCVINSLGRQKITKKYVKVFTRMGEEDPAREILEINQEISFMLDVDRVIELRKQIKNFYADHLTSGNQNAATNELEARMKGLRTPDLALISFYLGLQIAMVFCYFLIKSAPSKNYMIL
jgi:hypothetical protein